jgi:thymidine phosphorylase
MAKKYSVSSNHVLIDIPMGKTTKAHSPKMAKCLKRLFEKVGKKLDMNVKVIITNGSQPIGNGIGPLLEAEDVMSVLRNDSLAPVDLKKKAVIMAGVLLKMAGRRKGKKLAKELLESGQALKKMNEIIKAQGKQRKIILGQHRFQVKSKFSGKIKEIDNLIISKIARVAGAPKDKGSGLYLEKHVKDKVKKGELLYTVYAESEFKLNVAKEFLKKNNGYLI